ncbi:multiple inositol polyphosphate phosphatase 1-like [Choristoneura fumiferana]|uniref:multiple inositol polyphosphate phosphatase 1-like n=1 Tax=Choristoneura fumiferana TaxID=7141 RepID=UPI003D15883A
MATDGAGMKTAMTLKEAIIDNFYAGRGEMCAQDIANLANWTWDDSMDSTWTYLTKEGHQELLLLGQRVRERFSPLLGSLDTFQFRSTDTQRTRESTRAFVEGLEDSKFTIEEPIPDGQYDVIRPYRSCEKYIQLNKTTHDIALEKFRSTKDYQQMLTGVRQRVGLPDLTHQNVTGLYDLCRYYRAYAVDRRNAWCSVFGNEDLKVLEFIEDLSDQYDCGYSSPYGAKLGAIPLRNLYENLEASVNGSYRITGYFTHDTMIEMIVTALGLYHDYPAINSLEMNRDRKWRTSLLAPFATNLMVVLNKCTADDVYSYKIQVFMNEMMVPLCGDRSCDWDEFKEKMLPFADSNLDFCKA